MISQTPVRGVTFIAQNRRSNRRLRRRRRNNKYTYSSSLITALTRDRGRLFTFHGRTDNTRINGNKT